MNRELSNLIKARTAEFYGDHDAAVSATVEDVLRDEAKRLNPGRLQYHAARRLIRDNGRSAIKWLPVALQDHMRWLQDARCDPLATRVEILEAFKDCTPRPTPRETGDPAQMLRFKIARAK